MKQKKRLIERGFPCHQVGAETQRERDTGKAPPVNRLHVWWARRPLTPSRAAILASLLPENADPEDFLRSLGIEQIQAIVNGHPWVLKGGQRSGVRGERSGVRGQGGLLVDRGVIRALEKENQERAEHRRLLEIMKTKSPDLTDNPVILRWEAENRPLEKPWPAIGDILPVRITVGDPAFAKEKMALIKQHKLRFPGDLYGYARAFQREIPPAPSDLSSGERITVLDPTSGGGSIPFEAMRLGYDVIANELNPVAGVILRSTLDYPTRFGKELADDIEYYGKEILRRLDEKLFPFFPDGAALPDREKHQLAEHLHKTPEFIPQFDKGHVSAYLFARQVICPHCKGEVPLLNSCWVCRKPGNEWGVELITEGRSQNRKIRFETYPVKKDKGTDGHDPNFATVNRGVGFCLHCHQAVSGDEIKAQARGDSVHGKWRDRLYCTVTDRFVPELDKQGNPLRFKSGAGNDIKTRKIRFFRGPDEADLTALKKAEKVLKEKWGSWERQGIIPTEKIPPGQKTGEPLRYGMSRWIDLFTPRQLLCHLTRVETLNRLKPRILEELGADRGRAVITYLQYAVDKGLDYNSRQTRWIPQRASVSGTFGRHDFSVKWTFGETIFTGPSSGARWGLSQVTDAYKGIADLVSPVYLQHQEGSGPNLRISGGTAAHLPETSDQSVDLVCMDPPYYDNVQYAELSDYFYVWQKRTLKDLYPELFSRRLTNKKEEVVANSVRHGSSASSKAEYQRMMEEIFAECFRVLKADGLMTLMFTHKSQDAWETLTCSLIESGWIITATVPVASEFAASMHQKHKAAAASAIFIACRKRKKEQRFPSVWTGIGGAGVQHQICQAVEEGIKEFAPLGLNPVDHTIACYGRALRVLSEQWPVMDGDEPVMPVRAMNEASRVVSEYQIREITGNRITVDDLDSESAMALILLGVWGIQDFSYSEALNLSKSLNIPILSKNAGYRVHGHTIGMNTQTTGRRSLGATEENQGFHAPLVRKGSKLRLSIPEERNHARLRDPQTDWDIMQGLIQEYRKGDIPLARPYLDAHAPGRGQIILDLLHVWAEKVGEHELKKEAERILFSFRE